MLIVLSDRVFTIHRWTLLRFAFFRFFNQINPQIIFNGIDFQ